MRALGNVNGVRVAHPNGGQRDDIALVLVRTECSVLVTWKFSSYNVSKDS